MAKDNIKEKILVIGSGPVVIGQAAEFDYSGTQACLALREEGYTVVLCNPNPATIMTDTTVADIVYMEPLTVLSLLTIIKKERPHALLATLGGQTGLTLAMELEQEGILKEYGITVLGTAVESIRMAEDREAFKELCQAIGQPVIASDIAHTVEEGLHIAEHIGYPVVLRPAFTLGGTGGGFAEDEKACKDMLTRALALSPVHQVLVEKSVAGYKEIEYEVMRDCKGTAICICDMENIDPVGVHTGDSIVVCPSQSLDEEVKAILRESALALISALHIEGGCNVQFAVHPSRKEYYCIEVNPRVSRSSALASKASGYPIAGVSAKIALGKTLDEIMINGTNALFEPQLDYIVYKMPRFPFDKFPEIHQRLGTQMKATGEVMAIGKTNEEALLKAVQSLDMGLDHIQLEEMQSYTDAELAQKAREPLSDSVFAIAELLRRHEPKKEWDCGSYDISFIKIIENIIAMEERLVKYPGDFEILRQAKEMGFSDSVIAKLWKQSEEDIYRLRQVKEMAPVYKMIHSWPLLKDSTIPYFYSTYIGADENRISNRKKVIILGAGPIRIGQGIEFDYSTVHAIQAIREEGYEAIVINNNPETVSTDYSMADRLYFEPLTVEHIRNIVEKEKPVGIIVALGGQTAINLAPALAKFGIPILGTSVKAIQEAEHRGLFEKALEELAIPKPMGIAVGTTQKAFETAEKIGYPLLVRPSFVLGGRGMEIIPSEEALKEYLENNPIFTEEEPLLIDRYISGKEVEVDAICDGEDVFVPGIMELVEKAGIHSGDSISVYPPFSLSKEVEEKIIAYTIKISLGLGIIGLYNIQFIVDEKNVVYCLEVNPRSSRTIPFLSKATGIPLANIGTKVMLGLSLKEQGVLSSHMVTNNDYAVKVPVFSFMKLEGIHPLLSPEMKSTGEVIGLGKTLDEAMQKGMMAANMMGTSKGKIFISLDKTAREEALSAIEHCIAKGVTIVAEAETAKFMKMHGLSVESFVLDSDGVEKIVEEIRNGSIVKLVYIGSEKRDNQIYQEAMARGVYIFSSIDTLQAWIKVWNA